MAGSIEERPGDGWATWVAHRTFIYTMIGAALFIASVFIFIL
jgi:hypothetical protein